MIVVVVMLPKKEGVRPSAVPHYFLVEIFGGKPSCILSTYLFVINCDNGKKHPMYREEWS